MASESGIYKLVANGVRRPSVWMNSAPPPEYWREHFNGGLLPEDWVAPEHWIRNLSCKPSDCISATMPGPLLSERAVGVFQSIAPGCAEYRFFTRIKEKPYYVMNVLAIQDILDAEKSESSPGGIRKYAFKRNPDAPLFKLPGHFLGAVLCTDVIPSAVVENKLTGFGFRDPAIAEFRDLYFGRDTNCYPGVLP